MYKVRNNNLFFFMPLKEDDGNKDNRENLINKYLDKLKDKNNFGGRFDCLSIEKSFANTFSVCFEVTQKCNLKCEYCTYGELYESNKNRKKNRKINIDDAKAFIDYLYKYFNNEKLNNQKGKPIFFGFYGGEPLIEFKIIKEIVDYIEGIPLIYNKVRFSITTNGLLLDKHMDYLAEKKFDLSISLDGDASHNRLRVYANGKQSFSRVFNNLKNIQKKYPEYFNEYVRILSVLNCNSNITDINAFFLDNFNKESTYSEISSDNINKKKIDKYKIIKHNVTPAYSLSNFYAFLKKHSFKIKDSYLALLPEYYPKYIPTETCIPFSKRIFVTVNGHILPCEKIDQKNYLGYVYNKNVFIDFENIANSLNKKIEIIEKKCNTCNNSDSCKTCLYYIKVDNMHIYCKNYTPLKNKNNKYLTAAITNRIPENKGIFKELKNNYHEY